MTALLVKVGAIVVSKVKECVTIQAGARFTIEDTGYWWYKHGDKSLYLNNDYIKEDHNNEELTINLHQGDCYFYFGTDVDLSSIGFGDFKFSAMIDNNYNVCFNTPFGEWSLSTKSLIQNIGVKLLDWGKCQFTLISDKIWKVFSLFTGSRNTNLELYKSPSSLNYPGLKIYKL